jgi:hypothetical protein
MLGPASGIKVNSLSYHLINSDDIHHHAVPLWIYLDRDSARQLRCWGVCRSNVLALSPEPKRWRLPLSFGQTVCRAPQASALADMYHVHYVDYPPSTSTYPLIGYPAIPFPNTRTSFIHPSVPTKRSNTAHHPFTHPLLAVPGKPPALQAAPYSVTSSPRGACSSPHAQGWETTCIQLTGTL